MDTDDLVYAKQTLYCADLKPGDLVYVRSFDSILNQGEISFDPGVYANQTKAPTVGERYHARILKSDHDEVLTVIELCTPGWHRARAVASAWVLFMDSKSILVGRWILLDETLEILK